MTLACAVLTILAMETPTDCRNNAEACRALAAKMPKPHRDQLLEMAKLWEEMASERAAVIGEPPRFDIDADG